MSCLLNTFKGGPEIIVALRLAVRFDRIAENHGDKEEIQRFGYHAFRPDLYTLFTGTAVEHITQGVCILLSCQWSGKGQGWNLPIQTRSMNARFTKVQGFVD